MNYKLTHTKHPDYQKDYVGRSAQVVADCDDSVMYNVIQNGKTIVSNYVLPRTEFRKRYG